MSALLGSAQRAFLTTALLAMAAGQVQSCGGDSGSGPQEAANGGTSGVVSGGTSSTGTGGYSAAGSGLPTGGGVGAGGVSTGGNAPNGGALSTGGTTAGNQSTGGNSTLGTGGSKAGGGSPATGGSSPVGGAPAPTGGNAAGGSSNGQYVVAMVQSTKAQAADITQDDIETMVTDAVTQAGGLDFIKDGQTVVLKPNLLTPYVSCWNGGTALSTTVNGVTTDWRVTRAVADLVRAKNPTGKILVMEGSNRSTTTAFSLLGYTSANFGTSVDEFIALEGASCANHGANYQTGLVQKPATGGKLYWVNQRYFEADVVISIGAMKTHGQAGVTGCVKNLGIGATPNTQYSVSTSATDCTRNMSTAGVDSYIDHSLAGLGQFVHDYYSVRPADFAIMDGLQGLQNGPCTANAPASDKMNMRVILAARNAVALDTVESLVMGCDPQKVPYLTKLEADGLGTTDTAKITVVGRQVADVLKQFAGPAAVCN